MSMLKEVLQINGWVEVILKDKDGRIKVLIGDDGHKGDNGVMYRKYHYNYNLEDVVTNVGLAAMLRLIFHGFTENRFGYIAIGTGTTSESPEQTALENEIIRKPANTLQMTTDITDDTVLLENVFSSEDGLSGSHEITEIGIFNADMGGIMLARKAFSRIPVNWDGGDNLYIRYFIQMRYG